MKRCFLVWGEFISGCFLALLLVGVLDVYAAVSEEPPVSDEECLGCHDEVDRAPLARSPHKKLTCAECHIDITETPHAEKLPPVPCQKCHVKSSKAFASSIHAPAEAEVDCQSCHGMHAMKPAAELGAQPCRECHGQVTREYLGSVHAKALAKGNQDAALCFDCHGEAHRLRSHKDPQSPTFHSRTAETCGDCHADRALVERGRIPIPQAYQLYRKSVHGRAVAAGKPAATCNDCHESHDLRRANDPRSSIYRENIPRTCSQCHAKEAKAYLDSVHGVAMTNGVTKSPVCTDCHGEHSIAAARDPDSRVSVAAVSKTCSSCHEAQGLSEKYGIPGARLETYAESFHGLAVRGGAQTAANCASCHGTHNILPSENTRSTIHPMNLPRTCGQCHPGAGIQLASAKIHVAPGLGEHPLVMWIRRVYLAIILMTIGGMSLHNGLDFVTRLRERWRADMLGERARSHVAPEVASRLFERLTVNERIQHGVLLTTFTVLVISGFALKFPESWWARPLVWIERGSAIRAWTHRIAGVLMTLAAVYHLMYVTGTQRGRSQLRAMVPRFRDVKEALWTLAFNLGRRQSLPRFQRFNYVEKLEYWAVVWGTLVMAATGFIMWFQSAVLRRWPLLTIEVATVIHYYEAWLATLAILVWHFYSVIFRPDVYPMSWVWLSGKLTGEQMAEEHPEELEEILAAEDRSRVRGAMSGQSPRGTENRGPDG